MTRPAACRARVLAVSLQQAISCPEYSAVDTHVLAQNDYADPLPSPD